MTAARIEDLDGPSAKSSTPPMPVRIERPRRAVSPFKNYLKRETKTGRNREDQTGTENAKEADKMGLNSIIREQT
jgi:hypothetical protein